MRNYWTDEEVARLRSLLNGNRWSFAKEWIRQFPGRSVPSLSCKATKMMDEEKVRRLGYTPVAEDIPVHWDPSSSAVETATSSAATETRVSVEDVPRSKTPAELGREYIESRAKRDLLSELRAANEHLRKELSDREDQIQVLQELRAQKPLGPIVAPPMPSGQRRVGMPWALFSDLHIEERVEPNKVAGLNEYNLDIADQCFKDMAEAFVWLSSDQRFDCRQAGIWIGGDTFSGYIHAELQESNFLSPVLACVWLQERFERLLRYVLAHTKFETIRVAMNDGNHGRLTQKMRASTRTANSLEYLLYRTIAARFADEPRLEFQIAEGEFNYVDVFDKTFVFMHGDSFRYQGGVGGLLIPVRRGFNELRKYRQVDHLVIGHFHQRLDAGDIIVNGSAIGTTPWSMSNKFPPEPRQQSFFMVDAKRGKCVSAPIWLPQYTG